MYRPAGPCMHGPERSRTCAAPGPGRMRPGQHGPRGEAPREREEGTSSAWSILVKLDILLLMRVNVGQAKTNLSELLARAEAGEEIEIARNGVPVARLSRVERPRRPGERFRAMKGALAG